MFPFKRNNFDSDLFRKELYEQYAVRIQEFIHRYVASEEIAEDLMHDVFIKIFELTQRPKDLKKIKNWESYIFRMARNHTLDFLKRNSLNVKYISTIQTEFEEADTSVSRYIQEKEYFEFLENCLNTLPERSREIFGLCRDEEKSYIEVADQLGISKSTVKHHMVTTMKKIREEVEEKFQISVLSTPNRNG